MTDLDTLTQKFGIADALTFSPGTNGLPRAVISTAAADVEIYLHGAHITRYQPAGSSDVLFVSSDSLFAPGKAIRGGVPVIFPWFGPKTGDPSVPAHGIARTVEWRVEKTSVEPSGVVVLEFSLDSADVETRWWPAPFAARFIVKVGATLDMTLTFQNRGDTAVRYENALHTYFAVSDVREVSVEGLAGVEYLDKTDGGARKTEGATPIRITGETDRVYLNTRSDCVLDDPAAGRRIIVGKSGSESTVVWNPWIAKARAMPDFGDDEWPRMLCIETANAAENALTLAPGETQTTSAAIRVEMRQSH